MLARVRDARDPLPRYGNGSMGPSMASLVQGLLAIFRTLSPPPTGVKIYDDIWCDTKYRNPLPTNGMLVSVV